MWVNFEIDEFRTDLEDLAQRLADLDYVERKEVERRADILAEQAYSNPDDF